jgi:ABC-type glycerol-3-phosphate transport system substrate-binding protein
MKGWLFSGAVLCCMLALFPFRADCTQLNWMGHWKGEGKREQLVHEIKKNYEFLHPGTTVNLRFNVDIEGEGDYFKMKVAHKIVEMIKTGKIEWDLVFCDIAVYRHVADLLGDPLWGQKYLVDFATVPGFLESQKEIVINTPFFKEKIGNMYLGPFIEGYIFCLWYNSQTAEKVGIKIKERGMTADEFIGYAKALSEYNKRHGTRIPFLYINSLNRIEALFEDIFKSQFTDPQLVIEEKYDAKKAEAFLATLEIFEKLSHYQPLVNEGWRTYDWIQCQKDFLAGNGLFIPGGTFMYNQFHSHSPQIADRGIPVEQPHVKQPNGLVGLFAHAFAVMKDSPNRQAAIDLSMMWSTPETAEKWVEYTRNPTGIRGNLSKPIVEREDLDIYGRFLLDMEKQYGSLPIRNFRAPTYVFGKGIPITDEEFRSNLVLILEGKLKAKDYYRDVLSRVGRL